MFKKLETVIVMDIYNAEGQQVDRKTEYIYKELVKKQDVIAGLTIALIIGSVIWN